jgi:hypothetical protein
MEKTTMKTAAIAVTLFCALPLAQAGPSFLITNGTFETGTLAGWTATTGAPFMDVTGSCNDGFAAQSSAVGCATGTDPAFGTYAAYSSTTFPAINNNVGEWDNFLSQNIVVPVGPINNATLTLDYTATWGSAGTFFHGVAVEAEILQGSNFLYSAAFVVNPGTGGSVPWTPFSSDITSVLAAHAGQTLTFELLSIDFYDTRGGGTGNVQTLSTGYDNVQIEVNTPEPEALWMAGGGLLLLVLGSRVIRRWASGSAATLSKTSVRTPAEAVAAG